MQKKRLVNQNPQKQIEQKLCKIKKRPLKINQQDLSDLWDNVKQSSTHVMGVPEGENGEQKNIFEEIMASEIFKSD